MGLRELKSKRSFSTVKVSFPLDHFGRTLRKSLLKFGSSLMTQLNEVEVS